MLLNQAEPVPRQVPAFPAGMTVWVANRNAGALYPAVRGLVNLVKGLSHE